jgi:AcrR family transcriptional regulator
MSDTTAATRLTRKERAELSRQRILAAAVEEFTRRPFNEVSVADLAQAADVAHGLLFHHFQSKRALYLAALREVVDEMGRRHSEGTPEELEASPGVRARGMFRRHLSFMSEMPTLAVSIISGGIGSDPEAREIFEADRWRIAHWWFEMVDLDIEHPALRLAVQATMGAVDSMTVHWIQTGGFDIDAVAGTLVSMLVGCLRSAQSLDPTLDVDNAVALLLPGTGHTSTSS